MSDATEKLALSRLAILQHAQRRERRRDRQAEPEFAPLGEEDDARDPPASGGGWFGHMKQAIKTWWRYHPAHMVADLAAPVLQTYAERKPVQLLAISAAAGAALMLARPWKLISLTTVAVAVLKSSQLSG